MHGLNTEQKEAVHTTEGALLVLAGAGSGKTRVVTYRMAHLIEKGTPPSAILGLTFTNKAAAEMNERVRALTSHNVLICTFHSLGARILRESIHLLGYANDFTIYDEEDVLKLLKTALKELNFNDKTIDPKALKNLISKAKNALFPPEKCAKETGNTATEDVFPAVYHHYQLLLKKYNALDFDDLLYLPAKLFGEHPETLAHYQQLWTHLLIDEYQDTNEAQYKIVKELVKTNGNICVVGDPDQSIYSWRGANINNILNFEEDFPGAKVIRLERNYRSRSNILEAANHLINYNTNRFEKALWSDLGEGDPIKLFAARDEQEEARFVMERIRFYHEKKRIPLNDMVIFYRTNFQSRVFEDQFLFNKIPYQIIGGISFYQRKEIKDILALLRMVHSGSDYISFARTINLPKRGIGATTLDKIRKGALSSHATILEFCRSLLTGSPGVSVRLSAKQKKGLEEYLNIIDILTELREGSSLDTLVMAAIERSGYLTVLAEDPETFDDRKGNLDQLVSTAMEWEQNSENPHLGLFLEELSLKSNLDQMEDTNEKVNLMTIHNGKGLEFPLVFLVGMEEDLFPHINSKDDPSAIEEERRLCYVGITRAKEYLYLTHTRSRYLWGVSRSQWKSRFLKEIPAKFLHTIRANAAPAKQQSFSFGMAKPAVEEEAQEPIAIGDAIFHHEYGIGSVEMISEEPIGLTYEIIFTKDQLRKKIVAEYASLIKL